MMLRVSLVVLVAPLLILMGSYLFSLSEIDQCVSSGGFWNYRTEQCGEHATPFIPFMMRHPLLVNGGMLLAVMGFFGCLIGLYRGRR